MKYFVILTVVMPTGGGLAFSTVTDVVTCRPGTTRQELYKWAFDRMPSHVRTGNVVHFSAEPDALGGGR